ncbi:hypothetical protein BKA70DRAFT_1423254 [Coprinopsis sp. MPI-PUGE-AT-0042]|nr:hypothetical protein BKA70DRAFT_1423254 [Coprinopsis sp. MPI-PUGE-AT-0042]
MSSPQGLEETLKGDLPSYSQSVCAPPTYSCRPSCDEQVLQETPSRRLNSRSGSTSRTGTYVRKCGKTTIMLSDLERPVASEEDESDASIHSPVFGRNSRVQGAVLLEESEMVTEVVLEMEAKLDTTTSDGGAQTTQLYHQRHLLWTKPDSSLPSSSSTTQSCPAQIQLDYALPSTYRDKGSDKPLPPSYTGFFEGSSTLYAKTIYQLRVRVTRLVSSRIGFWTKTKTILVPFDYYPRTRASRPIVPTPGFFSSIKTSPEEWYQASSSLKPRCTSTSSTSSLKDPFPVHLFLPAGRVYALSDTIPFHLQITGRTSALQTVFSSSPASTTQTEDILNRTLSCDSHNTTKSSPLRSLRGHIHPTVTQHLHQEQPSDVPKIRVYLMRQLAVEVRGERTWRNTVIGEGSLEPVPPSSTSRECAEDEEEHLDWEGSLKCKDSVDVGGFMAGNVHVKDFVMLSITPTNPSKTHVLELALSIPIRLVTDSCEVEEVIGGDWTTSRDPTQ